MDAQKPQGAPVPQPSAKAAEGEKVTAGKFPIVGMGASAGGLEAFEQFFRNTPVDSGMAFVLVSHLAPDHDSQIGRAHV